MLQVLNSSWALLLGMCLMMVGNGLQGSLLAVRGEAAGFEALAMSVVMSSYFAGFLIASRVTPAMIRRVGHVRVFAALGSLVSAVLILYPVFPNPVAWSLERVLIGFCFCGVYVTAESWLNNAASNDTRGQALSLYMIVQMTGIIASQGLLLVPDSSGWLLFVVPSVLVSISFAPILLSITPTPAFESSKPMTLREIYQVSPLSVIGMLILGGIFAAQFGMSAVYAASVEMTLPQMSMFVASFYVGALVLQYPLGWISDRVDRRKLIIVMSAIGGMAALLGYIGGGSFTLLLGVGFVIGAMSNPLYALLIAYANDFLEPDDMPAASAGLLFANGLGAIAGPLVIGWAIQRAGPSAFFLLISVQLSALVIYGLYRMTQRAAPSVEDTASYAVLTPAASPVAVEVAQEYAIDTAADQEEEAA
ncbi:MAG: MFS transporter [Pseudoprimorskyibacter sp.]|nr:MFS transporter [Pseudoprimorskyibacter sp.]